MKKFIILLIAILSMLGNNYVQIIIRSNWQNEVNLAINVGGIVIPGSSISKY